MTSLHYTELKTLSGATAVLSLDTFSLLLHWHSDKRDLFSFLFVPPTSCRLCQKPQCLVWMARIPPAISTKPCPLCPIPVNPTPPMMGSFLPSTLAVPSWGASRRQRQGQNYSAFHLQSELGFRVVTRAQKQEMTPVSRMCNPQSWDGTKDPEFTIQHSII